MLNIEDLKVCQHSSRLYPFSRTPQPVCKHFNADRQAHGPFIFHLNPRFITAKECSSSIVCPSSHTSTFLEMPPLLHASLPLNDSHLYLIYFTNFPTKTLPWLLITLFFKINTRRNPFVYAIRGEATIVYAYIDGR